ncbi:formate-dependent nitrite reductase complex bifunctional subunit NrfFG [Acidimicrobiaceae bacterium]|nr:formate-dependent nitrite reductase complex bifunctional subunit NrfFG [Acidimicrobiaceae bacterium]
MKTKKSVWLAMLLLVCLLLAFGATRSGGPLTQQDRIDLVTSHLACPTCSGESVFVSRASAAEAIRTEVARQVGAGIRTDDEIISYIEQRFGSQVLLVPRSTGLDSLVWSLPVAVLIIAMSLLVSAFVRWGSRKSSTPSATDEMLVKDALAETSQDDEG